jgi:hypothetical protein
MDRVCQSVSGHSPTYVLSVIVGSRNRAAEPSERAGSARMTELCEVVITAPDPEWLFRLTRALVADGLCASAHSFTPERTVYR